MGVVRSGHAALERLSRLLLDGRPGPPAVSPRNPVAISGFVLSLVSVASAPFPLLAVWEQPPEVIAALGITCCASFVLAIALSWLGLRRSNRNRQPWELRSLDGRLALAGLRIALVTLFVCVVASSVWLQWAFERAWEQSRG